MKFLKKIGMGILVLLALLLIVSLFLPSKRAVERSIIVTVPAERVFARINKPGNWLDWMSQDKRYQDVQIAHYGKEQGVGAIQVWESKDQGRVTFTIVNSVPDKLVEFETDMENTGLKGRGAIILDSVPGGVNVTFRDIWNPGNNLLYKYLGLGFDAVIGPELEMAAASFKAYCQGSNRE